MEFASKEFTRSLILRSLDNNSYELAHDSLAKKIAARRPTQRRQIPIVEGNPYKGLVHFGEEDARLFFGRTESIDRIMSILKIQGLVVVSGVSGIGKSSLVTAGVIPRLRKEGFESIETIRVGEHPMTVLQYAIDSIIESKTSSKKAVLFVDQFEELITVTVNEGRSSRSEEFLIALRNLLEAPGSVDPRLSDFKVKIIITVRSDFEPQFRKSVLAKYWDSGLYPISGMTVKQLELAIEKPAELAACYFEPFELINTIAQQVADRPGSLPLLSVALAAMFEASLPSRIITREIYNRIGVFGALELHAERIYMRLPDDRDREILRMIMLRMVSGSGNDVANGLNREDLQFEDSEEMERTRRVLNLLLEERLLVLREELGVQYLQPVHEALLRSWGRLSYWINEEFGKENILFRENLTLAATEWLKKGEQQKYLWTDERRAVQLKYFVSAWRFLLNSRERYFAEESLKGREAEQRKLSRRRVILGYAAAFAVSVLTTMTVYLTIYYREASTAAFQQRILRDIAERRADSLKIKEEETRAYAIRAREAEQRAIDQANAATTAQQNEAYQRRLAENALQHATQARDSAIDERNKSLDLTNRLRLAADTIEARRRIADSVRYVAIRYADEARAQKAKAELLYEESQETVRRLGDLTKNVLVPFIPDNFKTPTPKFYYRHVERLTSDEYVPVREGDIKLGAYGKYNNGYFYVQGNLEDDGIALEVIDSLYSEEYSWWSSFRLGGEAAEISIKYSTTIDSAFLAFTAPRGTTTFSYFKEIRVRSIKNLDVIAAHILSGFQQHKWDRDMLVVTEVLQPDQGALLMATQGRDLTQRFLLAPNTPVNIEKWSKREELPLQSMTMLDDNDNARGNGSSLIFTLPPKSTIAIRTLGISNAFKTRGFK